jgi:hypothetical protein
MAAKGKVLLEEDKLRIHRDAIVTPDAEYPLAEVTAVERGTYKPFLVPLALAVFGLINAVIAVQTQFWLDYLASAVMLGGGMWWRGRATRHLLRIERGGSKETVWQTKDGQSIARAMECLGRLVPGR